MLKMMTWLLAAMFLGFASGYAEATVTTYVVAKNDNLSMIAKRFCGNADDYRKIATENAINNPDIIHAGQTLRVQCQQTTSRGQESIRVINAAPVRNATGEYIRVIDASHDTDEIRVAEAESMTSEDGSDGIRVLTRSFGYEAPVRTSRSANSYARPNRVPQAVRASLPTREIISSMLNYFTEDTTTVLMSIAIPESGLNLSAIGYNCTYTTWYGKKKSRACKPHERGGPTNWSVDCGLLQINHRGQSCPGYLLTLEGNLRAAKWKMENGGFKHWVTYKKGLHKPHLNRFTRLVASIASSGWENARLASVGPE